MNKRVLFVIPYLYEGGAQRALSNIEMNFPDDWEIETLVNSEYKKAYPVKGIIHSLGISETPKTDSVLFQFRVFLKRINKLKELKNTGRYDACISMADSASVANILSGNKHCKTIISIRTSLKAMSRLAQYKYVVNPLARVFYNSADKVVAVSEELKKELIEEFKIKQDIVVAIPNGYNLEKILTKAKEPLEDDIKSFIDGKKVICNVGRLSFPKGQWHLIRSFKRIKAEIPEAVLMIAGIGELEEYLHKLTKELDLEESVRFLGHTDNVYKYLKSSDVFAFPSILEGFPNAMAEAVCIGLPCVATDFKTGAREILAPEIQNDPMPIKEARDCSYGILTPLCSDNMPSAIEELEEQERMYADAVISLLRDDNKMCHYREKSLERKKTLDIKNAVDKWVGLLF